ncbi:unnamed protein product [Lactuca saligna]|uniref:Uncharacterized protein n=1 Tax=Lactuca saligna TaxID=75948 RepID=A0AA35ZJX3_LACSI|nr:unnamed protein product [Lactuca saligna]
MLSIGALSLGSTSCQPYSIYYDYQARPRHGQVGQWPRASFLRWHNELQELHLALEEAKVDIVGLWALKFLIDKDELPKRLVKSMYVSYLAGCFWSVRFGLEEAHGLLPEKVNWLFEKGGFVLHPDETFSVDFDKVQVLNTISMLIAYVGDIILYAFELVQFFQKLVGFMLIAQMNFLKTLCSTLLITNYPCKLWEATISNAPSMVPQLLAYFPSLVDILERSFDHLKLRIIIKPKPCIGVRPLCNAQQVKLMEERNMKPLDSNLAALKMQ